MKKKKMKLTQEELDIEASVARGEWEDGTQEDIQKFVEIAHNTPTKERVNLRVNPLDLKEIRVIAKSKGIPYQTLIGSVIHQYVTNQFSEKKES